ncbi:MAG TPA: DUF2889 domain-containing protein [Frankiaceae bacterium]|nr:DUF2889 domain-containing protein [Frankiaceae bacterium]
MPRGAYPARPLHPQHGPHNPADTIPARRPGSARRTSTVDNLRPDGVLGPLNLRGYARDLVTGTAGATTERTCSLAAEVDFTGGRILTRIESDPAEPRLSALLGARVSAGFRGLVGQAVPDHAARASRLHLLLDDLPVATLVGGYAVGAATRRDPGVRAALQLHPHKGTPDLCAGWRSGGTIMLGIEATGQAPVVTGPVAPLLEQAADPQGWHHRPNLPPHSVRRARLLDVYAGGDVIEVNSVFRDSHVDEDGVETVIHEYLVHALIDPESLLVLESVAEVKVLPWVECPAAVGSAGRLVGRSVRDLRAEVRADFTGISTCTHLNDQLRSLADVPALLDLLA